MTIKRIGVIGLGSIGMRHAKNMLKLGQQVAGYDPDEKKIRELLAAGGVGCNHISLLAHECDGIMICSPTPWHRDHIQECFSHDCAVFVEKPIADVLDDDLAWVDMVGYNLRFHSSVIKARKMLEDKSIGIPIWASFTCSQKSEKRDYIRDGVILNWSHEIDLALYLLGPAAVMASSTRTANGFDDMTDILLVHDGGCRSTIHLDYLGDPEIRNFQIMGTSGNFYGNLCQPRFTTFHPAGKLIVPMEAGTDTFDDNYITEDKEFLSKIGGQTSNISCDGAEALDVIDICQQVRKQAGLI